MNNCELNMAERMAPTRIKTLVVDDSPLMLKILAQILKEAGNFDLIGTATDGCQGLRHVSLLSPELVVMDAHMPRLNGIQATRCIKQREHPPEVIIVTSDDSTAMKKMAEEAGADGFVVKDGNLRHRLITAFQDLFCPPAAKREKTITDVKVTCASSNKISEKCRERCSTAADERTARCSTSFLEAHSARKREACLGSTTLLSVHSTGRSLATANRSCSCALPHEFSPLEKASLERHNTMKARRRQAATRLEKPKMAADVSPRIEEIRHRAHEIFMARGGTPGNELDDWLRAEQELKQQRAGTNSTTT